jgi:hypothetical protein
MAEHVMSTLEHPKEVVTELRAAVVHLGRAHGVASEIEGVRGGLNGPWRDVIFGINTAVDTLAQMIEDPQSGRYDPSPIDRSVTL